jgi:hypothetical protein
MLHNSLYRLARSQKLCLNILGVIFLLLSALWVVLEVIGCDFPMEPCVVFVGGTATLLASYWPWKPTYRNKRMKGRNSFDYQNTNNRIFEIGKGSSAFTLEFSKASDTSIHMYNDPKNIVAIALSSATSMPEIRDVSALNFANRSVTAQEGSIVALRNVHGSYALVHIHDVRDVTRSDDRDEVTFSYVINPKGKTDFS